MNRLEKAFGMTLLGVLAACGGGNDGGAVHRDGDAGGADGSTSAGVGGAGGASISDGGQAAVGGSGGEPATGGGAPEATVRVMTVNLLTFITAGEAEARTAMVAQAINELEPDVVALQEIAESYDTSNRAEALAQATGYEWGWEVAHDFGLYKEGTGFLSRWPVSWTDAITLPHGDLGGTVDRVTLGAGVQTPQGDIAFFSSHATLDSNESHKADQALATWGLMNDHAPAGSMPAFLGADMNAEPATLAMTFLRGDASHEGQTGDLTDAWLSANPSDPGLTNPAPEPDKRIDYIYARGATVTGCELVLTMPEENLQASDHYGVVCDFVLP
jgi:endonuclease/exonuclease/phosphatase family metal-dependent hydrolase